MAMNPDDNDAPQLRRLQDWWLNLPLSYRLNALLYFLGACFMVFLLTSLLSGGSSPRQIQVGAGSTPASTTTTSRPSATAPTSTTAASTSSSTGPTTTSAGGNAATATTQAQTNPPTGGGGSGGGGGGEATATTAVATTTTVPNTVGTVASTTTTTRSCRNSADQACGQFNWEPGPNNQRLAIGTEVLPANPQVNAEVTFRVTVTDADHTIGTCAFIDFGDLSTQGSCPDPPCPARYGTWDLPAPGGPGAFTFVFTHTYKSPGPFIATFLVDDRSDCWDPYGERQTKPVPVVLG
jgi:hypothetical protein